jgi:hypothetical protein
MSKKEAAGALATIGAGLWTLVTGLFDPVFLLEGAWFPVAKGIARYVGPAVAPSIPWPMISGVLGIVFVGISLHRLGKRKKDSQ